MLLHSSLVRAITPWSLLVLKRTSFHRCYWTEQPNELPVSLLTEDWLCCLYFWHLLCILYFLVDIYIYTYLESLIFPQNSHRCSCEVPPQPTFKNLPSLYAVYTDINCNRQDSHQHIFVFVSHPQLCQGHLWGPQLCFHCSKWRDALYCCYCFKAHSMSSLCHAPLCCQCTARSIYYWGKIIDGVLSPSSHLHVFKSHSFTICFCRRF